MCALSDDAVVIVEDERERAGVDVAVQGNFTERASIDAWLITWQVTKRAL